MGHVHEQIINVLYTVESALATVPSESAHIHHLATNIDFDHRNTDTLSFLDTALQRLQLIM